MAQYTFGTLLDFDIANIVLPSGYTKLNYIENQGNASTYIDTGYIPNQNTKLRSYVKTNTNSLMSMGYLGAYRYGFCLSTATLYVYINTGQQNFNVAMPINTNLIIEINNTTRNVFLNYYLLGTITTMNFPIGGTYWIGRVHNYNSQYFNGKILYNEFLENDISVQKLIPCEDGNGNIGMYDVVTDIFFANQGTNPFISGGVAPTYNFQNGDEIIISLTKTHYQYQDGNLVFWYQEIPPLVFKGITFEQTDYWQKPEMVFRGFSFEITDKTGGSSMFHGMN